MSKYAALKKSQQFINEQSCQLVLDRRRAKNNRVKSLSINSLIEEHGDFVFKFIRKRTWDGQNHEDIYQSTMVEALKSFKNFRGESHPRTWLCGIAFNMIRNHAKTMMGPIMESIEDDLSLQDYNEMTTFGTEDPSDIYVRDCQLEKILHIFNELPHDMRITFEEVMSKGKSYEETAASLNLPIGTVRSRISRVREIFRNRSNYNERSAA